MIEQNLGYAGKMSQYFINFAATIPQNRPMNELILQFRLMLENTPMIFILPLVS